MCEVLWRNISDFYVDLRVEVAAVSRDRYGVGKTVDTHKILINAIKCYASTVFPTPYLSLDTAATSTRKST
jgi:hypothetical protein